MSFKLLLLTGSDNNQQLWEDFFSLSGIHYGHSSEEWEITKRGKEELCGRTERKIQTALMCIDPARKTNW